MSGIAKLAVMVAPGFLIGLVVGITLEASGALERLDRKLAHGLGHFLTTGLSERPVAPAEPEGGSDVAPAAS